MYAYMRILEEERMKSSVTDLSTYMNGDLRADTIVDSKGNYGARFYDSEGHIIAYELYEGHSESYAEDAAENYVFGIKKIGI